MNEDIEKKVLKWFMDKIRMGDKMFSVDECILEIGLDPQNKEYIETIDDIFQRLEHNSRISYDYNT